MLTNVTPNKVNNEKKDLANENINVIKLILKSLHHKVRGGPSRTHSTARGPSTACGSLPVGSGPCPCLQPWAAQSAGFHPKPANRRRRLEGQGRGKQRTPPPLCAAVAAPLRRGQLETRTHSARLPVPALTRRFGLAVPVVLQPVDVHSSAPAQAPALDTHRVVLNPWIAHTCPQPLTSARHTGVREHQRTPPGLRNLLSL